ncbi:MAG: glycine cleavage system protein GcvH [Nitrososphaerales archaeon]|nr:glycine cleavage system protein GcvH [Nitrososphaerales archaeon]
MRLGEYDVPDDLKYTKEHEWAKASDASVLIGITDYAAKTLNDVVYVTLPKVGDKVTQFKTLGTVESIKAVSELYSPITGTVTRVNEKLNTQPELVNKSPYSEGWLVEVKPADAARELRNLLDAQGYHSFLGTLIKDEQHR